MLSILQNVFDSDYLSILHRYLIIGHAVLALIAIVAGPMPMLVRKGGKHHRRIGNVFLWSMIVSLMLAIILLLFRFNVFLAGITALSLNGVVTGVRVLHRKRPEENRYAWFDGSFAVIMLLAGIGLVCYGIANGISLVLLDGISSDGGLAIMLVVLPIVFGAVVIGDTCKDIQSLRTLPADENWWWYYHMERMLGSYIALTTAFAVQQIGPQLSASIEWVAWVLPTVIGSPLIVIWVRRYRRRFSAAALADGVAV